MLYSLGLEPASSKASITAGSEVSRAARCRAVSPFVSCSFGSSPALRQALTSSTVAVSKYFSVLQPWQLGAAAVGKPATRQQGRQPGGRDLVEKTTMVRGEPLHGKGMVAPS